jgi:predicted dehydrogenase
MLAKEKPDIVSVCVWPHLHAPVVIGAAQAGVKAIHCEKPMATTWGDARRMVAACAEHKVQITFNHQRRFGAPFRKAKELVTSGTIGQLTRIEAFTSNLYDWGTHWFDMMFFYNDEEPAEWVIGQIDARGGRTIFGARVEAQGLSLIQFRNGVYGLMVTGQEIQEPRVPARETLCGNRLIGTDGVIEVQVKDGPQIRFHNHEQGGQWQEIDVGEPESWAAVVASAIQATVESLKAGCEPELSARKALQATELIFATYQSSRLRARVDLPLLIDDSPLLSMLASGDISAT